MRSSPVGRTVGLYFHHGLLSAALFVFVLMGPQYALPAQGGDRSAAAACDRECLRGFMTEYLNALVAHNPATLPLAGNVRITEDTKAIKLSESKLWKTAAAIRPYRQDMLDAREGVAGAHVIMEEAGKPVMLLVRLKVVDKKIIEIETQTARSKQEGALFQPDFLVKPTPAMNREVPAGQANSREEMIEIAILYPIGLKVGSFVTVDVPFSSDAYRSENGSLMAGKGCVFRPPSCENIKTQKIAEHPLIDYRVAAVDEELGITWMRMNFGARRSADGKKLANELIVWEAFKVYGGQIHAVEAFMRNMPVGTKSGWDDLYPAQIPRWPQ